MRGNNINEQEDMYSYIPLERRVPADHPLRKIRKIIDSALEEMDKDIDALYSHTGRPSIPPEVLLRSMVLQYLYGIRSERLLLENLEYNLLYRWFIGIKADEKIWNETVFSKNRTRLFRGPIVDRLMDVIVEYAIKHDLMSDEHFTVDGTLIESWASLKSFKKKDQQDRNDDGDRGNPSVDFHGEKRSNKTHQSTTDPEATLYRKSKNTAARLYYMSHVLMENRNGLVRKACTTKASYYAEHEATLQMAKSLKGTKRRTLGADKHYDNHEFCNKLRELNITPHVAQNIHSRRHHSAIDGRTTSYPGYEISQKKRKRVEEIFGWMKEFSIMRRPHFRRLENIDYTFKFAVCVYNTLRISNLLSAKMPHHELAW